MKSIIRKEPKRKEKERLVSAGFSFCSRRYTDGDSYIVRGGRYFLDDHPKSHGDATTPMYAAVRGKTLNAIVVRSRSSLNSLQRSHTDVRRVGSRKCCSELNLKKQRSSSNLNTIKNMTVSLSSIESVGSDNGMFAPLKQYSKSVSEKSFSKIFMCRAPSLRRFSLRRTLSIKSSTKQTYGAGGGDYKSSRTPLKMFLLRRRSTSVPSEIFRTWSLRKNKNNVGGPCIVQSNQNIRDANLDTVKNGASDTLKSQRKRRNAVCEVDTDERLGLKLYLQVYIKEKEC